MENNLQVTFNYQEIAQQLSQRVAQLELEKAEQATIGKAWQQKAQELHQELSELKAATEQAE
ncbi:hypothetical protein DXP70_07975 [Listeria monocytogenes]|nr:hypothetical protein [Listeria monocytogenes]MDB02997.1 hypothetical protein [Listeria monocytogenes]MDB35341.1 hypothetical protein [Listeria monocytogenes]HAB7745347.1 hypothetical protein [Listeria monocytogenes]